MARRIGPVRRGFRKRVFPSTHKLVSSENIVIFRGRVIHHKDGRYTVIVTKSSTIRVFWAGGVLPPMVYVHKVVCGVGKLVTYDEGERWRIVQAIPFSEDFRKVTRPLWKFLWHFLHDPAEWATEEQLWPYRKPPSLNPYK